MKESKQSKGLTKEERMGSDSIPKLVVSFSLYTLAALVFNTIYNLTDTLFVSWGVGDTAMGGVSVVFPFVILQGAISTAVGGGAAAIVSRKLGEGKREEAGEVTLNAMLTFYITAIVITAVGFAVMEPLLGAMGVTEELYPHAKQYFVIILAGNVFSTGFSSIIRAEGKMLYGLLIWIVPITINIVLDAVFILALGWGVAGSAAATVISQFISFIMCVVFFAKFSTQKFKGAKIKFSRIGEIIAIGLPSLIQMGSLSVITFLINNALKDIGGSDSITAFGYMMKLMTYAIVPFTAVTQALMPIAGYNYGAGNARRVKQTFNFCVAIGMAYAVIALALAEAIPQYLMMIFTYSRVIIDIGANGIRIMCAALILMPLPMIAGALMQAQGKKLSSMLLYSAQMVFMIPSVLIMRSFGEINGIWWSYVIACALTLMPTAVLLICGARRERADRAA